MRDVVRKFIRARFTDTKWLHRCIVYMVWVLFCTGLFFLFYAYIAELSQNASVRIFESLAVQVAAFCIGLGAMYAVSRFRYQIYRRYLFILMMFSGIAMLALVTPLAIERNGAVRWIDLGLLQFQPSEMVKLACILFFAYLFTDPKIRQCSRRLIGYTLAVFAVLGLLSWAQPDYGTALIIVSAVLGMALIARLPKSWWLVMLALGVMSVSFLVLTPSYISTRVSTFYDIHFSELTPEQRYGVAYQPLQNLKAVRVGGALGQGPGFVAQTSQLDIPELTTDSIFALVAAETGFLGSTLVILLFLFFFTLCYTVADITRDVFGKYLVVGITTMFASQFFINILVVLALPATGIPLIFFSRGGTSLLMTLVAIGIILSVLRQQQKKRTLYHGSLEEG